jgi:4-amino-4-deoxy-L-arabinose transferase-like glycosyltransferase
LKQKPFLPYRPILLIVLLAAAVLRFVGLNNVSPPGLEHDEVAHWLINRAILEGHHAIYFTEAYGHEAGFHYLQTAFQFLLGDNAFALRLPAAFAGLLLVPVTFALARRLFGLRVALIAAAWLAVLCYPVFYSRLALRAISLPLLSGLSAYFWWKGWLTPPPPSFSSSLSFFSAPFAPSAVKSFLLAGLFAGLSLHTYMAGRAVPIFYALFVLYLALFHRPRFRQLWPAILLFFVVYLLVAGPLLYYLFTHPGAEERISEVNAPFQALLQGDLRPVISNSFKIAGMFGIIGDPLWRQNVAGQPLFEPVSAILFYAGVFLSLWRWPDSRYLFLILWLFTATIPSILTIDVPNNIRIINTLPILTLFPALVIHRFIHLSTEYKQLSTEIGDKVALSFAGLLILLAIDWTAEAIFQVWPAHPEVAFVWQKSFTDAAAYLDSSADSGPVAIAGWTPNTMDPPTMELTLRRGDLSLRYFDPTQSLLIPAAAPNQPARLLRPTILPLDPSLAAQLTAWNIMPKQSGSFTQYAIRNTPSPSPQFPAQITFANQLTFLGHDPCHPVTLSPCHLITYWRIEQPSPTPLRFFLHLVDAGGQPIAQEDRLDAPAEYWQPGDLLLQLHTLAFAPDSSLELRLGVYNPETRERLRTAAGTDYVILD